MPRGEGVQSFPLRQWVDDLLNHLGFFKIFSPVFFRGFHVPDPHWPRETSNLSPLQILGSAFVRPTWHNPFFPDGFFAPSAVSRFPSTPISFSCNRTDLDPKLSLLLLFFFLQNHLVPSYPFNLSFSSLSPTLAGLSFFPVRRRTASSWCPLRYFSPCTSTFFQLPFWRCLRRPMSGRGSWGSLLSRSSFVTTGYCAIVKFGSPHRRFLIFTPYNKNTLSSGPPLFCLAGLTDLRIPA